MIKKDSVHIAIFSLKNINKNKILPEEKKSCSELVILRRLFTFLFNFHSLGPVVKSPFSAC
jgi:hypothetical protein